MVLERPRGWYERWKDLKLAAAYRTVIYGSSRL